MLLFVVIIIAYDYHIMIAPYKSPTAYFRPFAIVLVALDFESKSSGYEQSLITIFGHQPGLVGNRHKKQ